MPKPPLVGELAFKIKLQKKQAEFWMDIKQHLTGVFGYGGARGGGKSYSIRNILLARRIKFPGTEGYLFRKTYDQLESNHINPMLQEHPQLAKYYNASKRFIELPNGSRLYFRYLKRPQDAINYQGLELEDVGLDEATQHPESVFDNLRASNRSSKTIPGFKPIMMLSFNPGGVGHGWIKRKFIKREFQQWEDASEYHFTKALVYDNPKLIKADPAYLKRLESLPPDLRKAFLHGSFDVFEGQYFEEFLSQTGEGIPYHVIPFFKPDPHWKKFIAVDWGYYPGWFVAIWFAVGPNKRLYVYRELSLQKTDARTAGRKVVKASGDERIAYVSCDPSMFTKEKSRGKDVPSIAEEFSNGGIPWRMLRPANNDRINGWMVVRKYLSAAPDHYPWMQIMDTCKELIRTLPDQVHDEINAEDLDTDGDDHWVDALRYGVMTRPFRRSGGVINNQNENIRDILKKAPTLNDEYEMYNPYGELIKADLIGEPVGGSDPIPTLD